MLESEASNTKVWQASSPMEAHFCQLKQIKFKIGSVKFFFSKLNQNSEMISQNYEKKSSNSKKKG